MSGLLSKVHGVRLQGLTVVKTGQVPGKFKFASLADVWTVLFPVLKESGLSIGFTNSSIRIAGTLEIMCLTLQVSDGEAEAKENFEILLPESIRNSSGNAVTNSSQRSGGGASYARRTALILYFNIATGDDAEVERMNPGAKEIDRDAPPEASNLAPWARLMDGNWSDLASPDGSGPLVDAREKKKLWQKWPDHPGLTAWAADIVTYDLTQLGFSWSRFATESGGQWPASLEECTPTQVRQAANAVRAMTAKHEKTT